MKKDFKFRTLDKFILNEIKGPFFYGLVAFSILLVAGGLLFKTAQLIVEKHVPILVVARLFVYSLPRFVVLTFPMSCLLASLLGFGKLSSNSELVALKSAGLSFNRITRPIVLCAVFIVFAMFFLNEAVVPMSEKAAQNVLRYEILHEQAPIFTAKTFFKEEEDGLIKRMFYIDIIDNRTKTMYNIVSQEFTEGVLTHIAIATRANWENGQWYMHNGAVFEIDTKTKNVQQLFSFEKQILHINLTQRQLIVSHDTPDEMTIPELIDAIKIKKQTGEFTGWHEMTLHMRFAVPWACLIFALLGAALGSRPQRSSSSVGLGMSVIIIFAYYVILSFSSAFGENGKVHPAIAAWSANVIFIFVSLKLCRKANALG
ncbi:MAG: LptF/LptG family permease [Synergistaceae bacterium]|nr:LptF/LptG family permease [Synergistaceae bacterium]